MKVKVSFNTLSGPESLEMTLCEALESEVGDQAKHLLKLMAEGAVGFTFQHRLYGKVYMEMVKTA